jgi:hypothetical protein
MLFEKTYIYGTYETANNPDSPLIKFDGDFWVNMEGDQMHILTSVITWPEETKCLILETVKLDFLTL